jgi:hypothetical protein
VSAIAYASKIPLVTFSLCSQRNWALRLLAQHWYFVISVGWQVLFSWTGHCRKSLNAVGVGALLSNESTFGWRKYNRYQNSHQLSIGPQFERRLQVRVVFGDGLEFEAHIPRSEEGRGGECASSIKIVLALM